MEKLRLEEFKTISNKNNYFENTSLSKVEKALGISISIDSNKVNQSVKVKCLDFTIVLFISQQTGEPIVEVIFWNYK